MILKIHNTLTGTKEIFKPVDESHVRVYACGPTVYNFAHIGNARMAVANDLLINVLRTQFKKVTYVSNITDIDDKIIEAAHELNEPIKNLTTKYTNIYNEDMSYLNVQLPDVQPRATDHINEMIDLITKLIDSGNAYEKMVTYYFMCQAIQNTVFYLKETGMNKLLEVELKWHLLKKIQLILFCGNHRLTLCQAGNHLGDLVDQVGT